MSSAPSKTDAVAAAPAAGDAARGWRPGRGEIAGMVLLAGLFLVLFWDFVGRQVEWAIEMQADWGHTLVIPLIAGWFVWARREDLRRVGFRTTWFGFVPIVLGLAWYSACVFGPQVLGHHNLRAAGVGLTLFGLVLLFCGWGAMRYLLFPIAYVLVFGQTISDRLMQIVTYELQDITAVGAEVALSIIGLDIVRDGNTLTVIHDGRTVPLNIAEACSGMRMLMAFLALGTAMAWAGFSRWWQRVLLIAMGVPVSIIVNILRVMTLSLLTLVHPDLAAGQFHSFIGLMWLLPAFLMYLGVMWIVRNLVVEAEPGADAPPAAS